MSVTRDQLPEPGDEVLCIVSDPKLPDMAWIEFMSGKRVEVRIWNKPDDDEPPELPTFEPTRDGPHMPRY